MQAKLNEINALPAKTWRWMGVNGVNTEVNLPSAHPYTGECLQGRVPEGMTVYDILRDQIVFMDDEPDPTLHPEMLKFMRKSHNCGKFIQISAGKSLAEPLVLHYHIDADNPAVVDDNFIIAEEGSEATIVMHYTSDEDFTGFHCGQTKIIARKNAHVKLVQVQTLSDSSEHFDNVGTLALEGAHIEVIQAEMGGRRAFANCKTQLTGETSNFDMRVVYLGDGQRSIDLSVTADHYGKRTRSDITARGALLGESQKIFRGTIDFKKGASGSRGREGENTLLLGEKVRNRTAPLILCAEEDVDGRHAASVGRIDEDRLFYLMSRGLSELEAKKLTIEAEFAPIVAHIPVPEYRQEISAFLQRRLSRVEDL